MNFPGAWRAGAGLSIALACDLRVASRSAFITTAFVNIGLTGDYGGTWFLPRLIGLARAKELYYLGERISAPECERLGLFNRVFDDADFRQEAHAFANRIANGPTQALGRMKVNLNRGQDQDLPASLALEAEHMIQSQGSPETAEAIQAFLGKRAPQFHEQSEQ